MAPSSTAAAGQLQAPIVCWALHRTPKLRSLWQQILSNICYHTVSHSVPPAFLCMKQNQNAEEDCVPLFAPPAPPPKVSDGRWLRLLWLYILTPTPFSNFMMLWRNSKWRKGEGGTLQLHKVWLELGYLPAFFAIWQVSNIRIASCNLRREAFALPENIFLSPFL